MDKICKSPSINPLHPRLAWNSAPSLWCFWGRGAFGICWWSFHSCVFSVAFWVVPCITCLWLHIDIYRCISVTVCLKCKSKLCCPLQCTPCYVHEHFQWVSLTCLTNDANQISFRIINLIWAVIIRCGGVCCLERTKYLLVLGLLKSHYINFIKELLLKWINQVNLDKYTYLIRCFTIGKVGLAVIIHCGGVCCLKYNNKYVYPVYTKGQAYPDTASLSETGSDSRRGCPMSFAASIDDLFTRLVHRYPGEVHIVHIHTKRGRGRRKPSLIFERNLERNLLATINR